MTKHNEAHVNTLIDDIRDCAKRAHEFGYFQRAEMLDAIASDLDAMANTRSPSIPPALSANQAKRATASQCFRNAQDLLKELIKP